MRRVSLLALVALAMTSQVREHGGAKRGAGRRFGGGFPAFARHGRESLTPQNTHPTQAVSASDPQASELAVEQVRGAGWAGRTRWRRGGGGVV